MEQTPQPRDPRANSVKEKSGACPPKNSAEQNLNTDNHVVPSEKEIDISDEDRALDSGI